MDPRETQCNLQPVRILLPLARSARHFTFTLTWGSQKPEPPHPHWSSLHHPAKSLKALHPVRWLLRCTERWSCAVSEAACPKSSVYAQGGAVRLLLIAVLCWAGQSRGSCLKGAQNDAHWTCSPKSSRPGTMGNTSPGCLSAEVLPK